METRWYKLDSTVKNLINELSTKVEDSECFDTTELRKIADTITWYNLPTDINKVIQILDSNNYPNEIGQVGWYKLNYKINDFKDLVENFDCLNIPDEEAPTVPQNLVASNVTATSVQLDWDASTDNIEVDYYNIYKDGSVTDTRVGNTATISGLTASTTYNFSVSAVDTSGNESEQSESVEVVTTA